jgi:hypothetical protein
MSEKSQASEKSLRITSFNLVCIPQIHADVLRLPAEKLHVLLPFD